MIEWKQPGTQMRRRRQAVILALALPAGLIALAVIVVMLPHRPAAPDAAAIIAAGIAHDRAGQADDDVLDLAADEEAAGAVWARTPHPGAANACPQYSAAFAKGCERAAPATSPVQAGR